MNQGFKGFITFNPTVNKEYEYAKNNNYSLHWYQGINEKPFI
jgi:hypothetical protein